MNFTGGRHNLGTFGLVLNNESDQDILKFTFDFPLAGLAIPTFLELKYIAINKRESGELIGFRIFVEGVENEDIFEGWREYNDSIENKYKVNLPFLLEHFLKVYNEDYFDEQM